MFLNKICDLELKRLLIIKGSFDNFVRTDLVSGSNKAAQAFIPRIDQTPCDTNL
jgi:hypothetical protein